MIRWVVGVIGLLAVSGLAAQAKEVKAASLAELGGDLTKAYQLYKALADSSDPLVLAKCGHLAVSLGLIDEAADYSSRLLAQKSASAQQEGTLLKMKVFRLQGRSKLAQKLFEDFSQTSLFTKPSAALLNEALLLYPENSEDWNRLASLMEESCPEALARSGSWSFLPDPGELYRNPKSSTAVRLQIGVFRDWGNVQSQVQKLKSSQWVPLVEKTSKNSKELFILYIMSENPNEDLKKLKAQGYQPLPVQ